MHWGRWVYTARISRRSSVSRRPGSHMRRTPATYVWNLREPRRTTHVDLLFHLRRVLLAYAASHVRCGNKTSRALHVKVVDLHHDSCDGPLCEPPSRQKFFSDWGVGYAFGVPRHCRRPVYSIKSVCQMFADTYLVLEARTATVSWVTPSAPIGCFFLDIILPAGYRTGSAALPERGIWVVSKTRNRGCSSITRRVTPWAQETSHKGTRMIRPRGWAAPLSVGLRGFEQKPIAPLETAANRRCARGTLLEQFLFPFGVLPYSRSTSFFSLQAKSSTYPLFQSRPKIAPRPQ